MLTLGIRRRRLREKKGIGLPGDNTHILAVARKLRDLVDSPVLGGIAVYLHGGGRSTVDLDFYTPDRPTTAAQLIAAGARWDATAKEHVLDNVRIHTVSAQEAGLTITGSSTIDGIRVVKLNDLIAIKLISGLKNRARSRDLGDVEDLIRLIPLDKRFAPKLPKQIRAEFKTMVDAVRAANRSRETQF